MLLKDAVQHIRSKNAGPFWVTVDVFCGNPAAFETVQKSLGTKAVSAALQVPLKHMQRFDIASLNVIKFSFPRTPPQGARQDRDMHGAQYAHVLMGLEISA